MKTQRCCFQISRQSDLIIKSMKRNHQIHTGHVACGTFWSFWHVLRVHEHYIPLSLTSSSRFEVSILMWAVRSYVRKANDPKDLDKGIAWDKAPFFIFLHVILNSDIQPSYTHKAYNFFYNHFILLLLRICSIRRLCLWKTRAVLWSEYSSS